ncbi:MAG TPA: hypothetical protein DCZ88_02890 [Pseudanabaena sp.]|nr:hypothetical protein [Pseudanabaena sp.]
MKTSPLEVEQVLLSAKIDTLDYLKEAYHTLKNGGSLLIAETMSLWTDKKQELLDTISRSGFTIISEKTGDRLLYINATKPLISLI